MFGALLGFLGFDVGFSAWIFVSEVGRGVWFGALQDLTLVCNDFYCFFLSLFLSLWYVCRRRFLSFSFSQPLGKPNPFFGGLGFPLCFLKNILRPGRAPRPRPVRLARLLSKARKP